MKKFENLKAIPFGEQVIITNDLDVHIAINPTGNFNSGIPNDNTRESANKICKAVNNYDALLSALKTMVNEYDVFQNIPENYKELEGYPGDENPRTIAMIKAMEAIKKAEQ